MKYSPLAVHCTSLCFDVIQNESFKSLTTKDIRGFKEDVYALLRERTDLLPAKFEREHTFLCDVTDGVISVLNQCSNNPNARSSDWILAAMESRIEASLNSLLH
ncbi:hypothetical protein [Vibrio marisflavi]|uniref:Uncharacterized protein n=1 Tax=Vibrio marisflavi CECT 7928 TaxID=634439 RepID=A0ABN8DY97_9VIBR|nr:hypothetical protein [Vibrio marisflavi]CAH0536592.1 hypothetical protein VMF7928_00547 [Vibrio marisflavi CECT 7928]